METLNCDVLTGFLGSGKTTLLNAFLRSAGAAQTAVIINEVGQIGIDHLVVSQLTDNLMLLDSGCLCCAQSGTLRETILDLCHQVRRLGRTLSGIVIETSGLADPLPILHTLLGDKAVTDVARLRRVVTVIDATQFPEQAARHAESVRQAAVADVLLLSKTDLASPEQASAAIALAERINPHAGWAQATQVEALFEAQRQEERTTEPFASSQGLAQAWSRVVNAASLADAPASAQRRPALLRTDMSDNGDTAGGYVGGSRRSVYHQRLNAESFWLDAPVCWAGIAAWWHLLTRHYGKALVRCKGVLRLSDGPHAQVLLQGVGAYLHPAQPLDAWPDADARGRLVCIGEALDRSWLQRSLAALRIREAGALPASLEELAYFDVETAI